MPEPIEGVIIPAGWPLPSRDTAPPLPPSWRPPPPAAPYVPPPPVPRPDPQPPADVRVTIDPIRIDVDISFGAPPEPDPPTWAERLQLRRNLLCCAMGLVPATGWGKALHLCWQQEDLGAAWVLAGLVIGAAAVFDQRQRHRTPAAPTDRGRGTWLTRTALCAALLAPVLGLPIIGSAVLAVTGVAP